MLTDRELLLVKRAAKAAGLKPSEWIRKIAIELMDKLDNMSASELIQMLGDAGRDLKGYIANKLSTGMDKARDYFDRQYPDVDEAKQFPDLTGDGEVTRADILKGRGVDLNEALTLEEIKEAIADLKKKL